MSGVVALAGGRIVSCSEDGSVKLWLSEGTFEPQLELLDHTGPVIAITKLSESVVATASWDKTICLFNLSLAEQYKCKDSVHMGAVKEVAFLINKKAATYGEDGEWCIWELDTGKLLRKERNCPSDIDKSSRIQYNDEKNLQNMKFNYEYFDPNETMTRCTYSDDYIVLGTSFGNVFIWKRNRTNHTAKPPQVSSPSSLSNVLQRVQNLGTRRSF